MVTKESLHEHLQQIGNTLLKEPYKSHWTADNPTYGYCYVVSEMLFHYTEGKVVKPYCLSFGNGKGTHWFVTIDGEIVDWTADQFDEPLDYTKAVGKGFMKGGILTPKGYISKRGNQLAVRCGLVV